MRQFFCKYYSAFLLFLSLITFMPGNADNKIQFQEMLSQSLSHPGIVPSKGKFNVEGCWSPTDFNPNEINSSTLVAFDIGRWSFNKPLSEATFFDQKLQEAIFSFKTVNNAGEKVQWLRIALKWDQRTITFCVEGLTTKFLQSPLAGDFLADQLGCFVASSIGSFRLGMYYNTFELPLKGEVSIKKKGFQRRGQTR